ncbi:M20/M25/M40 family metallo-hydrolase [Mongoliibacter ruber]|uniref:Peptidase M28-like protein n=1 Tax=Mongoliibacter ruber TaxID=1750599 RepID=A0A2T0WSM6_9BACT|nr:M20/M25/M40 family metallo-hydrolase [Mongoliibacter ruber]PRY89690.1 peptidase M28-like protein [Mongoliibacter ruber]
MKKLLGFFIFFLALAINTSFAQQIDDQKLLFDLEYLASEELEGRKTGSEGAALAVDFIKNRFQDLGLTSQYTDFSQKFDFFNKREIKQYTDAVNVLGFIPGSESEKLIVITAHYDHLGKKDDKIFYGADDNASGTAALLAFAEYFSKNRPKHSMMFVALDAEEMGQHGSKALVKDFPFPIDQVVLNINMDMVSRSDQNELWAVGTYHYPSLKPSLEKVGKSSSISLMFGHDEPNSNLQDWTYSSDHAAFHREDIPFIYFGVDDHEDYHKETDTFENIDPEFFVNATKLILNAIIEFDTTLLGN